MTWRLEKFQFLLGIILFRFCQATESFTKNVAEKKLIDILLRDYDPRVRPVERVNDIINVSFSLSLMQIIDLDEKNQLLTTSMYMGWSWHDAFLHWNPSDFEGITNVRIPAKYVWTPDILIYNSASDSFDQMLRTNVIISSNGIVEWLPPGLFKTTCHVDILFFPFDEQKCLIKFGTWTYHGGLVDLLLTQEHAQNDSYTKSGEWEFLSMKGKRTEFTYKCCPNNPFVDITYTIHVRRRVLFFSFNLILPCILICSLTILVFALPADAGERITLGITILLALVVYLQMVAQTLPPSDAIPFLVQYFALSIIMVALSVVATVISLNFHHTNATNANEMPKFIRWIFLWALPTLLRIQKPGQISCRRKFLDSSVVTLETSVNGKTDVHSYFKVPVEKDINVWKKPISDDDNPEKQALKNVLKDTNKEMNAILNEVKFVTNRMHSEDKDELIALEWKFAAIVLDRFCLCFLTLYFFLSTVLTIGIAPGAPHSSHHHEDLKY